MIFPLNQITEFFSLQKEVISIWGDFGVGKTTLSLQCAILNSIDAKVLYIYTKPSFPYLKLEKIKGDNSEILDKVVFIKSLDYGGIYELILNLEFIFQMKLEFNLIIIDSLTDLYRLEFNLDKKDKNLILNYRLNHILAHLSYLNQKFDLGILIVNEITRKKINDQLTEIESGGNVMEYWVKKSIKIARTDKLAERLFKLTNQTTNLNSEFASRITNIGFI